MSEPHPTLQVAGQLSIEEFQHPAASSELVMPAEKDKKGDPESYFFFRPFLFVLNNIGTRKEGEKVI